MTDATVLTDRFDRALLYATHVHGGQVRKGTPIPYIAHLLAVAATVLEYDGSEDMAIAALLHDAVEDQGGDPRLSDIRNRFGDRVADIVRSCSDTVVNSSAGQQKEDWKYPRIYPQVRAAFGRTGLNAHVGDHAKIWPDHRTIYNCGECC